MDALDDIGPAVVEAIGRFFGEPHNIGMVDRLTEQLTILEAEKPAQDSPSPASPLSSPDRSKR
jgi:DNA ligase (NAD+)